MQSNLSMNSSCGVTCSNCPLKFVYDQRWSSHCSHAALRLIRPITALAQPHPSHLNGIHSAESSMHKNNTVHNLRPVFTKLHICVLHIPLWRPHLTMAALIVSLRGIKQVTVRGAYDVMRTNVLPRICGMIVHIVNIVSRGRRRMRKQYEIDTTNYSE